MTIEKQEDNMDRGFQNRRRVEDSKGANKDEESS